MSCDHPPEAEFQTRNKSRPISLVGKVHEPGPASASEESSEKYIVLATDLISAAAVGPKNTVKNEACWPFGPLREMVRVRFRARMPSTTSTRIAFVPCPVFWPRLAPLKSGYECCLRAWLVLRCLPLAGAEDGVVQIRPAVPTEVGSETAVVALTAEPRQGRHCQQSNAGAAASSGGLRRRGDRARAVAGSCRSVLR